MRLPRLGFPHDPEISAVANYWTYSFSLSAGEDVARLARKLLRSDLAENAVRPDTGEIRLSRRYARVRDVQRQLERLSALDEALGEGWFLRWAKSNPVLTARIVLTAGGSMAARIFGNGPSDRDVDGGDAGKNLRHMAEEVEEAVQKSQLLIGSRAAVDRDFLSLGYLEEFPFVRLELRGFKFKTIPLVRSGGKEPEAYVEKAVVTLLLHRSGVALLTIGIPLPDHLAVSDLRTFSAGKASVFTEFTLPESLVRLSSRAVGKRVNDLPGSWLSDELEGSRWRACRWNDAMPISDVFNLYCLALRDALGTQPVSEDWLCYHSMFVDRLDCCGSRRKWAAAHRRELTALVGRMSWADSLRKDRRNEILGRDWALCSDRSEYLHAGNAFRVLWDFSPGARPSIVDHFWTLVLVDHFLLQYWQLHQLGSALNRAERENRALLRVQREVIAGLVEFHDSAVVYESAKDMIDHLSADVRLERLYQRVLERLATLQQLVAAKETQVQNRRNVILAGLAAFAAVVFGLPAIYQSLDILNRIPVDGSWHPIPKHIGDTGSVSWLLYGVIVALLVAVPLLGWLLRLLVSVIRRPSRRASFGMEWPNGGLEVSLASEEESGTPTSEGSGSGTNPT